jgi:hypothetical protein
MVGDRCEMLVISVMLSPKAVEVKVASMTIDLEFSGQVS